MPPSAQTGIDLWRPTHPDPAMNAGVTVEGGAVYRHNPNVIPAFIAGIQYDAATPSGALRPRWKCPTLSGSSPTASR